MMVIVVHHYAQEHTKTVVIIRSTSKGYQDVHRHLLFQYTISDLEYDDKSYLSFIGVTVSKTKDAPR
jgi:hypothetical protein